MSMLAIVEWFLKFMSRFRTNRVSALHIPFPTFQPFRNDDHGENPAEEMLKMNPPIRKDQFSWTRQINKYTKYYLSKSGLFGMSRDIVD